MSVLHTQTNPAYTSDHSPVLTLIDNIIVHAVAMECGGIPERSLNLPNWALDDPKSYVKIKSV